MNLNTLFYRYFVYYPVTILRLECPYFYFHRYLKSQYHSSCQIALEQKIRLHKLLVHAKKYTSYYQENLPDISSATCLEQLPFLSKNDLRVKALDMYAPSHYLLRRWKTSGGSTGAPVTIVKSAHGMAQELAATWRGYSWAGIKIGDKQARFWGVPHQENARRRARMIDLVTNRVRLSAFDFSDEELREYFDLINREKPVYFYGYVSMIRQFAEFLQKNNLSLSFSPRCIITTSEVLLPKDKQLLEKVFSCGVFNEYGCGEVGTIAHECDQGNLHINTENIIVEIVDDKGMVLPNGQTGEIVVTDLTNYYMPLIRYKLNDYGAISNEICGCGRRLPILTHLHGRAYDIVKNREGNKFHGEFFLYLLEDAKKEGVITQGYQVEQLALDELNIFVVADEANFEKLIQLMLPKLKELFDQQGSYHFTRVDSIAREASGKLRVVKGLDGGVGL